jgi:hypothetical protein
MDKLDYGNWQNGSNTDNSMLDILLNKLGLNGARYIPSQGSCELCFRQDENVPMISR